MKRYILGKFPYCEQSLEHVDGPVSLRSGADMTFPKLRAADERFAALSVSRIAGR